MAFKFILKNTETEKSKGFEFTGDGTYIVGRATDCDIRVGDAKTSSKHFKIVIKNNEVTVVDLESRNGIAVDGYQVSSTRFYVSSTISFGVYTLKYDKKALNPKELICNTKPTRESGMADVTMLASVDDLQIHRDGIMDDSQVGKKTAKKAKGIASKTSIRKKIKKNALK